MGTGFPSDLLSLTCEALSGPCIERLFGTEIALGSGTTHETR